MDGVTIIRDHRVQAVLGQLDLATHSETLCLEYNSTRPITLVSFMFIIGRLVLDLAMGGESQLTLIQTLV